MSPTRHDANRRFSGRVAMPKSPRAQKISAAGRMPAVEEPSFWACAVTFTGSVTYLIAWDVFLLGVVALGWVVLHAYYPNVHLRVGPVEIAGGALGLILVFRNNAGYDRWWEGRKIWGAITNSTRSLVQGGLAFGPSDVSWRRAWVRWCASYPHACRLSLRHERDDHDFERLLGQEQARALRRAKHMPSYVTFQLAQLLAEASDLEQMPPAIMMNLESARQQLVAAIGKCERIASSPLPRAYVLKLRRFMAVYLIILPAALVERAGWVTPLLTILVAYSALGIDRIAEELQSPFSTKRLNHLPLEGMCYAIEGNSLGMLEQLATPSAEEDGGAGPTGR